MPKTPSLKSFRRIVVKVGSSLLVDAAAGSLKRDWLASLAADIAGLFSTSDLDHDMGGAAGCMADVDDPDCAAMFAAIGMGGTQTTFRVVHGGI